ncbi:sigma-70 family RNA polymerase sigma factor [Metabacillus herbersteinensis]|uniref:Sigma-70 family RNA polymerase sigma factor n=1 Tax=Metabacillus herbersteinensis TaxID=283816 RepID=A0ABV6GAP7_9BACI
MSKKTFEELLQQFEPMIYHMMKRLNIYENHQAFYQVGCIAIWEAMFSYIEDKGQFPAYLYPFMKGRMLSELSEHTKRTEDLLDSSDTIDETIMVNDFYDIEMKSIVEDLTRTLSPLQKKWFIGYCLYGKTPSEIAVEENVTVSAVKSWRREAIKRIRAVHFDYHVR